jgi:hypothetical protein
VKCCAFVANKCTLLGKDRACVGNKRTNSVKNSTILENKSALLEKHSACLGNKYALLGRHSACLGNKCIILVKTWQSLEKHNQMLGKDCVNAETIINIIVYKAMSYLNDLELVVDLVLRKAYEKS